MLRGDHRPKAGSFGVNEAGEAEGAEEAAVAAGYRALLVPMEPLLTLVLEKAALRFEGGGVRVVVVIVHRNEAMLQKKNTKKKRYCREKCKTNTRQFWKIQAHRLL